MASKLIQPDLDLNNQRWQELKQLQQQQASNIQAGGNSATLGSVLGQGGAWSPWTAMQIWQGQRAMEPSQLDESRDYGNDLAQKALLKYNSR